MSLILGIVVSPARWRLLKMTSDSEALTDPQFLLLRARPGDWHKRLGAGLMLLLLVAVAAASPLVDSTEPTPPRSLPVARSASQAACSRSRISVGPHECTSAAPGCLPKPTTAIFMQPDSTGPLKQV